MPRYERHFKDDHRFFEITLRPPSAYFYRWGRIGEQPKEDTQTFPTPEAAKAAIADVIRRSTSEQYRLVPRKPQGPVAGPSAAPGMLAKVLPGLFNPSKTDPFEPDGALVSKIVADADSPEVWYQAASDYESRGAKLAGRGSSPIQENSEEIWGKDLAECLANGSLAAKWRWGFVHSLFVKQNEFSDFEQGEILAAALSVPACRLLRELVLGNADVGRQDVGTAIKVLSDRTLPTVSSLSLLTELELDELSWVATPGDLSRMWRAFPNLEHVQIRTGSNVKLGKVNLPKAKSFVLETCGMKAETFEAIAAAEWPQLEKLDLMFGSSDEKSGGTTSADQVARLLQRRDLPNLKWLGLRSAEFTDDLVQLLVGSPLLPQLKVLDLSMGCLTDKGAGQLLNNRGAFGQLQTVNLARNVLSEHQAQALGQLAGEVSVDEQRLEHFDEGEPPTVALFPPYP